MAKKNWIQGAIKHPGALTRKAKAAGQSISQFCAGGNHSTQTNRQCAFAKTLKKLGGGKKK
jgi:hypothetical protein